MTQTSEHHPARRVKHLSPYLIPIIISIIGFIMICTVVLWPIGLAVLLVGLFWGFAAKWITRARINAERKGELPP